MPEARHGIACKVCRRRGRKCDRTLPFCHACAQRGVQCEGYVTRWLGVAARGKLAGKTIPVRDRVGAIGSQPSGRKENKRKQHLTEPNSVDRLSKQYPVPGLGSKEITQSEIDRLVRHCETSRILEANRKATDGLFRCEGSE